MNRRHFVASMLSLAAVAAAPQCLFSVPEQSQTIEATSGTFTLTLHGRVSVPLRFNASAAEIQAEVDRLSMPENPYLTPDYRNRLVAMQRH